MKKTLMLFYKLSMLLLFPFVLLGCSAVFSGFETQNTTKGSDSASDTKQARPSGYGLYSTGPISISMEFLNAVQQDLDVNEQQAEHGDAVAQYEMGLLMLNARFYNDAVEWFRKSAEQGYTEAQFTLGNLYRDGRGVMLRNVDTARYWYQRAAEQGHSSAEYALRAITPNYQLPSINRQPNVVEEPINAEASPILIASREERLIDQQPQKDDPPRVVAYKEPPVTNKAPEADASSPKVVTRVGPATTTTWEEEITEVVNESVRYSSQPTAPFQLNPPTEPEKEPEDLVTAEKQPDPHPPRNIESRIELPQPNINNNAYSLNLSSLQSAAEDGDAEAQLAISLLYSEGKEVPRDLELSVMWGKKAAEQGNAIAQNNLGAAFTHGKGVEKDDSQAAYWYLKAAEQGYAIAQYNLAASYAMGVGVEKDYQKAYAWFSVLLAQKGDELLDERADTVINRLESMLTRNGQLETAKKLAAEYVKKYAKTS